DPGGSRRARQEQHRHGGRCTVRGRGSSGQGARVREDGRAHLLPAGTDQLAGLSGAAGQVWPAFALVAGLLLIGAVAEGDGLVAVTTAVLNLDTSVFFLTPILLHLARGRGLDERPFLYGTVFMSNAASLYLPGSNLTNLIVLHGEHVSGTTFFLRTWEPALAA